MPRCGQIVQAPSETYSITSQKAINDIDVSFHDFYRIPVDEIDMTTTLAQDSQHVVMQTPAPVVAASDMSPFTCGDFSANMCLGQSATVNNVLPYHSGIHGDTTSNRYYRVSHVRMTYLKWV